MIFYLWLSHAVTAGVLTWPIVYLGRRRVRWDLTEVFDFIVAVTIPFTVWASLMIANSSGKSLSNFGECLIISLATPVAAAIRVFTDRRMTHWVRSLVLLFSLCAVAIGTYLFMPMLSDK
jgi:hypothetical protein